MNYTIRDEKGIALAKVDNLTAQKIISQMKGRFRDYRSVDRPQETTLIFEILEDSSWVLAVPAVSHRVEIFLWRGTKLIPE